jgi:hypothetical protein
VRLCDLRLWTSVSDSYKVPQWAENRRTQGVRRHRVAWPKRLSCQSEDVRVDLILVLRFVGRFGGSLGMGVVL